VIGGSRKEEVIKWVVKSCRTLREKNVWINETIQTSILNHLNVLYSIFLENWYSGMLDFCCTWVKCWNVPFSLITLTTLYKKVVNKTFIEALYDLHVLILSILWRNYEWNCFFNKKAGLDFSMVHWLDGCGLLLVNLMSVTDGPALTPINIIRKKMRAH